MGHPTAADCYQDSDQPRHSAAAGAGMTLLNDELLELD